MKETKGNMMAKPEQKKYTPSAGDWQAEETDDYCIRIIGMPPGTGCLVEAYEDFDGEYDLGKLYKDETIPIANLISAAPDMIDALKVFTLCPETLAWLEENDPMALRQARQAIEKAEGKD